MSEWLDLGDVVDHVQELMDMGLYDEAQKLLDDYEDAYGSSWEMPFLRARILIELGKPQESIPWFEKSLSIDEHNPDSLLGLFYAYSQTGRIARGAPYLLQAAEIEPDGEPVISALIWYYTEMSDYKRAIDIFDKARTLPPENAETWRNAGIAYQRIGDHERATECLTNALDLATDGDEERDMLADQYIMGGRSADAVQLYVEYLIESPRNVRAMSRLAYCLMQDDRPQEAEKAAKETIATYPNSTTGYVDLAFVYLSIDKPQLALEIAEKALFLSPIDAEVMRVKAIALSETKKGELAEQAFQSALALEPDNAEIKRDYYHHLRVQERIEDMERVVHEVIASEQPYCVEDCWFLADYYREKGAILKAFGYLRKALRYMPGERELWAPLIDIMLDRNHRGYSTRFLYDYVSRSGWNDTMNGFAQHKRLQGKMDRESLRFLRFVSEKGAGYSAYIFVIYFRKAFLLGGIALLLPLGVLLYSLLSWWGLAVLAAIYGLGYAAMYLAVARLIGPDTIVVQSADLAQLTPPEPPQEPAA